MSKTGRFREKTTTHPGHITGKIVVEFFNNEDENFKTTALVRLCKELHGKFNVSAVPIDDEDFENPERGAILFSAAVSDLEPGKKIANDVITYVDTHVPGRMIHEECVAEEWGEAL